MNRNYLSSVSHHVSASLKPQNILLTVLLGGQVAQGLQNDTTTPFLDGYIPLHTQTYQAPETPTNHLVYTDTLFHNATAETLLENPEHELLAIQDVLQNISDTIEIEIENLITELEGFRPSLSLEEQATITSYIKTSLGNELPPQIIQAGLFDIEGIRELAKGSPRITLLLIALIIVGVSMFVSNKGENLGHAVGGAIKNKSRGVGRLVGGSVGVGLGYLIVPEIIDNAIKPIKDIPIFQYIPVGQAAWFVAVIVLLKSLPLAKKLPRYGKGIAALLLSAWLYGNIMLDPKAIIKDKHTGEPLANNLGEKIDIDDYLTMYDEKGEVIYRDPQTEERIRLEEEKELTTYTDKLEDKQSSLLSAVSLLGYVNDNTGIEVTDRSGKQLRKCTRSYTTRVYDHQYGTHGIDKITYKFTFYPIDGKPIPMTILVNHGSNRILQGDKMSHITRQYPTKEGKIAALETVILFVDLATKQLEQNRIDWIQKLGGKKPPTDFTVTLIRA